MSHSATPRQSPLCIGFSRQEYWSGLPFPSPGDLPDPGIKPGSPALQADSLLSESLEEATFNQNRLSETLSTKSKHVGIRFLDSKTQL